MIGTSDWPIRINQQWLRIHKYHAPFSSFIFFIKPLKMDLTEGSETSAQLILTPGKYPKESIQDSDSFFEFSTLMFKKWISVLSNLTTCLW
jgi:hypothetical protein